MMNKLWQRIVSYLKRPKIVYMGSGATFTAAPSDSSLRVALLRLFWLLLFVLWSSFVAQLGRIYGKMEATLEPILTKYYDKGAQDGYDAGYRNGLSKNLDRWFRS